MILFTMTDNVIERALESWNKSAERLLRFKNVNLI